MMKPIRNSELVVVGAALFWVLTAVAEADPTSWVEVTQAQWRGAVSSNLASSNGIGDNFPVNKVRWDDCQAFISVTKKGGWGTFCIPSEASGSRPTVVPAGIQTGIGRSHLGMILQSWTSTAASSVTCSISICGGAGIPARALLAGQWRRSPRMTMGYMTCMGMCGSGARTGGITTTRMHPRTRGRGRMEEECNVYSVEESPMVSPGSADTQQLDPH